MDPHTLLQCFSGTLEVSQTVRENAERELRQLSRTPGFLGACLDIIGAPEVFAGCRKAAAVYFKNRVVRYWDSADSGIEAGEKPVVVERLVPVLASVEYPTKHQLVPALRVLVAREYPQNMPGFLPAIASLLQQQDDVARMYTGVLCFAEVCRYYRWMENNERETQLDPIIAQVFPHLLEIGGAVLQLEIDENTADLLNQILKAYKFVTYFDMPKVLQLQDALASWGDFHCRVISLEPPQYILSTSLAYLAQEKNQTHVAKCYKWAVANMDRIFRRYASRGLSLKRKMEPFREMFVSEFIPHVLSIYLLLMDRWCAHDRWLPGPAVYHILDFVSHCVSQKETWKLVKPGFESIVERFIYPLLCPSAETLELFDADPADYINSKLDNFDELEPDIAALGLLVTLVSKRKKTTAAPIVGFAMRQLTALSQQNAKTLSSARLIDGALRLVGGICHILTPQNSPFSLQMEPFLAEFVLPHLNSTHQFLRARTLDVCSKFADLRLQQSATVSALYQGILQAFNADIGDVSLPVMLQSALAIQAYLPQPQFRETLGAIILPTMAKLLALSNEIDNEAVAVVMQECVENFSPQLQPFGMDLMKNLVAQFMRLAEEVRDAENIGDNALDDALDHALDDAVADKITAALGLMNTMITVLLSFENSREMCLTLEEAFSPVVEYVLRHKLDDFITEACELVENSIFLLRAVTPCMWSHFLLLADSFSEGVALMYTEELSPCLKHYMVFGYSYLLQNPHLLSRFVDIILLVIGGEDGVPDYSDVTLACELAQTLILSLQHNAPPFISTLSKGILPVIALNHTRDSAHVTGDFLTTHLVNYVIACLMYDCSKTLEMLLDVLYLAFFFQLWLSLVPRTKRVYDIKLSILGLMHIANSPEVLVAVPSLASHIGPSLAALFRELPKALMNMEKQRGEFNESDFLGDEPFGGDYDDFNDDDDDDLRDILEDNFENSGNLGAETAEKATQNGAPADKDSDFIAQENSKFLVANSLDDDDMVFEDILGATPLDTVDPVVVFREFSHSLQANNPTLHEAIFDSISDDDRQVFVEVFKTP